MQELAPGIFVETGFRRINVGAILTGEGWVLIDTPPYPDDANRWREMLQSISEAPICAIVTTDCHRDRFLGNSWFDTRVLVAHSESISHIRSLPTAFVENAIESLVSDSVERSRFGSVRLRLPNVGFTRRMQLRYGGMEIPLLDMPGPTAGSLWVHLPEPLSALALGTDEPSTFENLQMLRHGLTGHARLVRQPGDRQRAAVT